MQKLGPIFVAVVLLAGRPEGLRYVTTRPEGLRHPVAGAGEALPAGQGTTLRRPDVPYVPTPIPVVEAMLALAKVTPADVVYDLGSGDGRIPITAAEKFGARGVGVEIDPFMVSQAEGNRARSPARDRVRFITGDLFDADLSEATVVTLFLFPSVNERLVPKLRRELRPGSRIVAHHFDLGPAWPADESREVNGLMIYLWRVG